MSSAYLTEFSKTSQRGTFLELITLHFGMIRLLIYNRLSRAVTKGKEIDFWETSL